MTTDDWSRRIDDVIDPTVETSARRVERITDELAGVLGEPMLVTDPGDGITRPTWQLEVPWDVLRALCDEHNERVHGIRLVDDSEPPAAD